MFHVLDHASLVFSGELSQATQYVLEHTGNTLDAAIRAGVRILYSDATHALTAAGLGVTAPLGSPADGCLLD
jgi:hypothetical protein